MTVTRFLLEHETYQGLDLEQQECINTLGKITLKPSDIEDTLINFVQYSVDKMIKVPEICDVLDLLITCPTAISNVSDAVDKMVKNGDGITNHITDLKIKPLFMSTTAWNRLQGRLVN